jgi:excinuclease UvrABC ATPase subunit
VGNTVIVAGHDADMIKSADVIVDLRPKAGESGGEVVFNGSLKGIFAEERSITGSIQRKPVCLPTATERRWTSLCITEASEHNLKNIDVEIPCTCLSVLPE